MTLTTQNSGKYLTKRWHEARAKAIEDRTQFSAEELEWLELSPDDGWGKFNKDNFKMMTQPIDQFGTPKTYDIRTRDECGDDDLVSASGSASAGTSGYVSPPICEEDYLFPDDRYCG
jgi:hypothetical protein